MSKTFISVDIEAAGGYPPKYSMLSVGAVVVENPHQKFYAELKPINDNFEQDALDVSGFTMEGAKEKGKPSAQAMREFAEWVDKVSKKGKAKMVAFPAGFDWQFVNYYFLEYCDKNPFGIAPVDLRSVYFGLFPAEDGFTMRKSDMKQKLGVVAEHTHNALDDAYEQAMMFAALLRVREAG